MNNLWGMFGTALFWILWPVWFVYFRAAGSRTRVLIVADGEVLLLKVWLGDKRWGLPGGGRKRGESPEACAVREVREETGIVLNESSLTTLGTRLNNEYGLRYNAQFYAVNLPVKHAVNTKNIEAYDYAWMKISDIDTSSCNVDVAYALKRYKIPEQASLL